MAKYRLNISSAGANGFWIVEQRTLFIWHMVARFSIGVEGTLKAKKMAKEVLAELRKGES